MSPAPQDPFAPFLKGIKGFLPPLLTPQQFAINLGLPWPPFGEPEKPEPVVREIIREVPSQAPAPSPTYVTVGAPGVSVGPPQVYVSVTTPTPATPPPSTYEEEELIDAEETLVLADVLTGGVPRMGGGYYVDILGASQQMDVDPSALPLNVTVWGWNTNSNKLESQTFKNWQLNEPSTFAVGIMEGPKYLTRIEIEKGELPTGGA